MNAHVMPIIDETIEKITELNFGVRPAQETINHSYWFVYSDTGELPFIVDTDQLMALINQHGCIIPELQE